MNNSNALATIQPSEFAMITQMADVLFKSGFLPEHIRNANQAVAIILRGRELRIGEWTALANIKMIHGNTTPSTQLMLALIRRSKKMEDMTCVGDREKCTVMMKRIGESPYSLTITIQEIPPNLRKLDQWQNQTANMLKTYTLKAAGRVVFPDVLLGMDVDMESDEEEDVISLSATDLDEDAPYQPVVRRVDLDSSAQIGAGKITEAPKDIISEGEIIEENATPKDLSGASANPLPVVPPVIIPPHWAADKANRDRVIAAFKEYGVTEDLPVVMDKLEKGVTKLSESKTASVDAYIALIAAAYPKQPTPAPAPAPQTTPAQPAAPDAGYWTAEHVSAFDKELSETYPGILISDIFEELGCTGWSLDPDKERGMVASIAKEQGWKVRSSEVSYHKGATKNDSFFNFKTPLGDLRWFQGTSKMIELTGQGYASANDIEHWRDLTAPKTIEPIILVWEKKLRESDQSEYLVVTGVQHTTQLDSILQGDPL